MSSSDGIAKHPEYYNHRPHPDMKIPSDTRKLRDVKIKEVSTWLMKRDWSPLGMYFSYKRFVNRVYSKYVFVKRPGANLLFISAIWFGVANYIGNYKNIKHEKLRKYH